MNKVHRLLLAILLSLIFMIVEVIGGYIANSIAIYSDAAHLLTDVVGFVIALLATITSNMKSTKALTFGYIRAEAFGALLSIFSLWIITIILIYAAYLRTLNWIEGKSEVMNGFIMFIVACFGILVNLCLGLVFQQEHGGSLHLSHSHDHAHVSSSSNNNSHDHTDHGLDSNDTNDLENKHSKTFESDHHDHKHHSHHNEKTHLLINSSNNNNKHHDYESKNHSSHDHSQHHHSDTHEHSSHHHNENTHRAAVETEDTQFNQHQDHNEHNSDVNIEAAYLHVITDLIQSVGVAIAGAVIWLYPSWQIIDPLCTFIFSIFALYSTVPLIRKVLMIFFEGVPTNVNWDEVMKKLVSIPDVVDVHDLHIWSISSNAAALTCHIRTVSNPQIALREAHKICKKLGITHATIQVHDSIQDEEFCHATKCSTTNNTNQQICSSN